MTGTARCILQLSLRYVLFVAGWEDYYSLEISELRTRNESLPVTCGYSCQRTGSVLCKLSTLMLGSASVPAPRKLIARTPQTVDSTAGGLLVRYI